MQFVALISRSGEDEQLPLCVVCTPALQLLEAVAPVPAAAEQAHHNQMCGLGRGVEVVIQLRRVLQAAQWQGTDPFLPDRAGR